MTQRPDEDLLGEVLGQVPVPRAEKKIAIHAAVVIDVEGRERLAVAGPSPVDDVDHTDHVVLGPLPG
jgi:hypothetical protein